MLQTKVMVGAIPRWYVCMWVLHAVYDYIAAVLKKLHVCSYMHTCVCYYS